MAEEKIFLVEGEIEEKNEKKPFSKKVRAKTASFAAEKAICLFGSKNKLKRNKIVIRETKEVKENAGKEKGNKGNGKTAD
jgi:ribosomal protein L20A (L18A)